MSNPYGAMLGQLVGLGASIAGTIPNKQDRLQRQIAMGRAEDPAVAALRRTLAAQNAATAMGVAASQQGVNPALAQRNAQSALAQQQIATNSELARAGMQGVMQARSSDPVGTKRSGLAQGLGMFANVLGTGMATQNAGMDSGDPSGLGKSFSGLASSVIDGAEGVMGL